MLVSIALISGVIAFVEGLPLIKNKMWKELIALLILLLIAILLVIIKYLNLPTPTDIMNNIFYPLGKAFFKS